MGEPSINELPELFIDEIDGATLDALLADVSQLCQLLEVRVKRHAGAWADGATSTLEEARLGLEEGSIQGIQLRYLHDGRLWCDTLTAIAGGYRLVRMEQPHRPVGAAR